MSRPTVLVVDDEPTNIAILADLLRPSYHVRVANSGEAALRVAATPPQPDLILLDVMMPGLDGFETMRRLRQVDELEHVPILLLTSLSDARSEEHGLEAGAADYLTKPIRPAVVEARVRGQLDLKEARLLLANRNTYLEAEVDRRVDQFKSLQYASIRALAHVAETRDTDTGIHILRTQRFVEVLARHLQGVPGYFGYLKDDVIELLVRSSPLHDIGKVGIPDRILLKPGRLTDEERAIMQRHTTLGDEALARAERDVDRPIAFLSVARTIARSHHEWWNGQGYPDGLKGNEIPIPARLMALADVFDALISPRVYKAPMPVEDARRVIVEERGTHFDPAVVDAFLAERAAFDRIAATVESSSSDR